MYLDFYGLAVEPFNVTPDPDFLFLSPSHREAFASLVYGVENRKGFVALTGEVGTGKTTILRAYLKHLKHLHGCPIRPIYLFNPDVSFEQLLEILLHELHIEVENPISEWMLPWLHWALIQRYKQNKNVVLIVDEAQNMPVETLEKLRMLSNLETTKDKLLQIVLAGQPEFDRILDRHELRQLRQRIAVRITIQPLTPELSRSYIQHRLEQAGCESPEVFSPGAFKTILRCAKGIPRNLNTICSNALITAAGYRQKPVSARVVKEVIADLKGRTKRSSLRWVPALAAALVALLGLTSLGSWFLWNMGGSNVVQASDQGATAPSRPVALHIPGADKPNAVRTPLSEPAIQAGANAASPGPHGLSEPDTTSAKGMGP